MLDLSTIASCMNMIYYINETVIRNEISSDYPWEDSIALLVYFHCVSSVLEFMYNKGVIDMHKDVENFCKNIKLIRETHNLSKKKMAECCGISVYSLNKIEQGILPPRLSYKVLVRLHNNFGIDLDSLFI